MADSSTVPADPGADAFIVGCGDIGRRVAERYIAAGRQVTALLRSAESADAATAIGAGVLCRDLDTDAIGAIDLPAGSHLYWFAPPPRSGIDDPRMRRGLAALAAEPDCIVYISTSAVYGDCRGDWVDESAPLKPGTDRGRRRVAAETAVRSWAGEHGVRDIILRVPGIYGPGRLPVRRLKEGLPVIRAEESPFTNRIHADDLADCALRVAMTAPAQSLYNVSDGNPTTMTDYFFQVADRLGLPRPPAVSWDEAQQQLPESMLGFLRESKRLRVERLTGDTGFRPRYPNLSAGLDACLDANCDD